MNNIYKYIKKYLVNIWYYSYKYENNEPLPVDWMVNNYLEIKFKPRYTDKFKGFVSLNIKFHSIDGFSNGINIAFPIDKENYIKKIYFHQRTKIDLFLAIGDYEYIESIKSDGEVENLRSFIYNSEIDIYENRLWRYAKFVTRFISGKLAILRALINAKNH